MKNIDKTTNKRSPEELLELLGKAKDTNQNLFWFMAASLFLEKIKDYDENLYKNIKEFLDRAEDTENKADLEKDQEFKNDKDITDIRKFFYSLMDDEKQELLEILYRKPSLLSIPNTKVHNLLFDGKTDLTDETSVIVSKKNSKNQSLVDIRCYTSVNNEILNAKLTAYEREIYNGICSIYESGQTIMTPAMIYESFAGKATNSPQALGHVTRSIDKLRTTLISIDWTQHAKLKGLIKDPSDCVKINDNLLHLVAMNVKINGTKTTAYKLVSAPLLYDYAKSIGQIVTVDRKLLDVNVSNTDTSIVLKNYMLRRIEGMKNEKNHIESNKILYESMFKECGITGDKTQLQRIRNTIKNILSSWIDYGYIKAFKEEKTGKSITGIYIQIE